jgi:hypothetical protein
LVDRICAASSSACISAAAQPSLPVSVSIECRWSSGQPTPSPLPGIEGSPPRGGVRAASSSLSSAECSPITSAPSGGSSESSNGRDGPPSDGLQIFNSVPSTLVTFPSRLNNAASKVCISSALETAADARWTASRGLSFEYPSLHQIARQHAQSPIKLNDDYVFVLEEISNFIEIGRCSCRLLVDLRQRERRREDRCSPFGRFINYGSAQSAAVLNRGIWER